MPARVVQEGGRFRATFPAFADVVGYGPTKWDAVAALHDEFAARIAGGELVWVDVHTPSDPPPPPRPTPEEIEATEEMIAEIYRERDALKAAEFPE